MLLRRLDVPFTIHPSSVEEIWPFGHQPSEGVESLALQKALDVSTSHPDSLTLGADTVVVLDGEVLSKPNTSAQAALMLARLSGVTHTVYTGLALVHPASNRQVTVHEATDVVFSTLKADEIDRYVATGSPMDKAGAYGIQDDHGAFFVAGIQGDYYNVVGLPLHRLYRVLSELFGDLIENSNLEESTSDVLK